MQLLMSVISITVLGAASGTIVPTRCPFKFLFSSGGKLNVFLQSNPNSQLDKKTDPHSSQRETEK